MLALNKEHAIPYGFPIDSTYSDFVWAIKCIRAIRGCLKECKVIALEYIRTLFVHVPRAIMLYCCTRMPWLYQFLPDNIELRIDHFLGNVTMSINTLYPIEREILSGMYEKHTVNVINIFVSKGDFCLDIGANIGAISFALAQRVGMHGTVMCFEPGPTPYYRFIDNLSLNPRLRRIIVPQKIGFSDSPGTMFWNEFEHNPGDANLTQTPLWNSVPVSVTTVDDYFEKHPIKRLNFVKIDVGNMASDVFKGGMNTWKKFTPIFYYETPQADTEPVCAAHAREIQCMLSSLGYSFYTLREDNTLLPARYPHYAVNTLALTDRQLYL